MKRLLPFFAVPLFMAAPAWAGMGHGDHGSSMSHEGMIAMNHTAMSAALSEGVVRKVDKAQGKLTLRHGPLENLGMPAMTMIFRVQEPAMLDRLKAGEQVRFRAEEVNGLLTVTKIEVVQ